MPAVSVVMPVYNRASLVRRAIDSVLAQDFTDFELIVVDDGSTDDTADVVAAIPDSRLRLIRLGRNAGGNAARNRGIEAATSPLVAFLDSDDIFLPHKLGFIVRTFQDRPEIDVLIDSFIKTYRPAREQADVEVRNPVLETNDEILEALFTRRIWKATPGISVRREAAVRAGQFDESLRRRQDFDFILRLAAVARCATTDELLWVKTYTPDAISADLRSFVDSTVQFYRRHPEYYSNPVYRHGFAHDVGRHFVRLLKRGRIAAAARDSQSLAREIGMARFCGLLASGIFAFQDRRSKFRKQAAALSGRDG